MCVTDKFYSEPLQVVTSENPFCLILREPMEEAC